LRRPWFKVQPVDESFFDSAPTVLSGVFEIVQPAPYVWAELTADNTLAWCKLLDRVEWTSPRPFGVGTTRQVSSLKGTNVIREHYFRWEEGRRKSFYVVEASAPLFRRFAEDYHVQQTSASSCRFTWTIAFEPKSLTRPGAPVNKRLLETLFTDTRKHYGTS
jgi:hypothetical protein